MYVYRINRTLMICDSFWKIFHTLDPDAELQENLRKNLSGGGKLFLSKLSQIPKSNIYYLLQ